MALVDDDRDELLVQIALALEFRELLEQFLHSVLLLRLYLLIVLFARGS